MKTLKLMLAGFLIALMAMPPAMGQSGCVIPGATTIVQSTSWSPLAADTGKIYIVTAAATATLPSTPPTAVWRLSFLVAPGGTLTINPGGLNIDGQASNEVFNSGASVTVSTDGTNYFTSSKAAQVRVCDMAFGDTSASAITNAQLGPQKRLCYVPETATVVEVDVAADGGTPNIILGRNHAGTTTNLTSSALATAASGGIACSKTAAVTGLDGATTCSATLQNTALAPGDYLEAVSGTAGGTAKLMTAHIIYVIHNGN